MRKFIIAAVLAVGLVGGLGTAQAATTVQKAEIGLQAAGWTAAQIGTFAGSSVAAFLGAVTGGFMTLPLIANNVQFPLCSGKGSTAGPGILPVADCFYTYPSHDLDGLSAADKRLILGSQQ